MILNDEHVNVKKDEKDNAFLSSEAEHVGKRYAP